jgi:hypothetical protein
MDNIASESDEITRVLIECEITLRTLHEQNRLTTEALRAFVDLSARVRNEMDRRRLGERRGASRSSPDRRVAPTVTSGVIEPV